ncbi:LysR family transcriptional regulator [Zavarzinella formosa]|uniref:LysR family transcriptional regulator n=1 Tax=Zavarzinella formosa TaxID=360055 RepID=UPI000A0199CE|nr:LysR family transcriptional regulator [Zavarzinella formosa]
MPRPASLSPELLSTFVTIVRTEGDATLAAEVLKINQPSMSKRLAFLQHAGRILRRPWIERVGKTWIITEEGRRVLPAAEELVHRYKLLAESIEEERAGIVFGTGASLAVRYVRNTLEAFRKLLPTETVKISQRPARERVEGVANGSLDLAAVRMADADILEIAHRPLHIETLWDDPMLLVAESEKPFTDAGEDRPTPKSVAKMPLLVPPPGSPLRIEFDRRCRDAGVGDRLNIVAEIGPWPTVLEYVKDGLGVGLLPRSAVPENNGLVSRPLPAKLAPLTKWQAICRKRAGEDEFDLSAAGHAFLKSMRTAANSVTTEPDE